MRKSADINKAVEVLRNGGLILYPTDTVWGLGCDARNSAAVERLYALKRRPGAKAMLILVDSPDMAAEYVAQFPQSAGEYMMGSERPTTVVLPKAKGLAPHLIAEDKSVGMRVPNDEFCRQLTAELGAPIVSTSVNMSGEIPARVFADIPQRMLQAVDYVCETGRERPATNPSRIIKMSENGEVTVIRE